jgi:hypothetical protein
MFLSVPALLLLSAAADDQLACKSMQSEARGNLKALYVAEEAYRAESDTYSTEISKLGFKPAGAKPRYSYEVKTATATKFVAEASASLNGRRDVWRIDESNNLVNFVDGCGDSASSTQLVDGEYELIIEQLTFKPSNGQSAWDPGGDPPDPIVFLKSPLGETSSGVTKNSYSIAGLRLKTVVAAGKELRLGAWDSDALSNDFAGSIAFIPSELHPDADGRVTITPQSGQLEGDISLRFKLLKAAAPPEPTSFVVDRNSALAAATPLLASLNSGGEIIDLADLRGPAVQVKGLYVQTCAAGVRPMVVFCIPYGGSSKIASFFSDDAGAIQSVYAVNPQGSGAPIPVPCSSLEARRKNAEVFAVCVK